jgi:hypothetical protein
MKRLLLIALLPSLAFGQKARDPAVEGPKIIAEATAKLSGVLGEAIGKSGPVGALCISSEKAPLIAEEIALAHGVTLRRATHKPRNPKNAANETEKGVLETFMAALIKKEAPKPQVITDTNGSRALLAPETLAAIQKLYPDDQATGFQLGDLRRLWRMTFPAK